MQKQSLFTLAALSATCLLPATGAWAQNDSATTTTTDTIVTNSVMDVGQFRDSLHNLHDIFSQIRENHTLALAAQDDMVSSKYEDQNRRLLTKGLGVLDEVTRNWKHSDIPSLPGETAEMRSSHAIARMGTADAERFATESDDTAFVRNTVWDIQNELNADKLNGRDPYISRKIMSMLDAAISRSENPSFRVAWHDMDKDLLSRNIEISRTEVIPPAPAPAPTTTEETTTTTTEETPAPAPTPEATTPAEAPQVAEAPTPEPTTTEETNEVTTERTGAANLPQTGGDPGMLVFFGSSLMGVGALLRRRK
jgi:LPXTG-motif cell wall-anchored protein